MQRTFCLDLINDKSQASYKIVAVPKSINMIMSLFNIHNSQIHWWYRI